MKFLHNWALKRSQIAWALIILWVGLVFNHYFSLKPAFDLSFLSTLRSALAQSDSHKLAANWKNFLQNLFCALSIFAVIWRLGRRFLIWMGIQAPNPVLGFCFEMALGILALNAIWLGLGLNGLWFDCLLWVIALVLLGWALWDLFWKQKEKLTTELLRGHSVKQIFPGRFVTFLALLGILSLVLDLLQGLAPDVYFDSLVYHLSTLQFWKFHHGIADFHTNLYSYFPFGAELYFANGFILSGSEAAKLLNAFSAALLGLAAAGWAAGEAGLERGLTVWAMVLILPLVSSAVWTTQNDVLAAFFLVLFFYALTRWVQSTTKGPWALMAGLLGGAALTIKYTAAVGIISGLLALIFIFPKEAFSRKTRKGGALLLSLMVFSTAPWILKNYVYTGNGFYPYLSSFFGGRIFPAENMGALMVDHEAVLNERGTIFTWIAEVLGRDLNKTIAPLLFGFIPFLFLGGYQKTLTRYLLMLSYLYLAFGFLISHQLRLMIPAFAVCFVAMALVLGEAKKKTATYAWAGVVALFGILSVLTLCRLSVNYYQTQMIGLGAETREEYLTRNPQTASYYGLAQAAGLLVPSNSQLLVVGDARGLYYPRPYYTNSVFDVQVLPALARQEKDGDGIHKRLREMGIDALVVSGDEGGRLARQYAFHSPLQGDGKKLEDFIQRWTDPLYLNGLNGLYRLRSTPAERKSPIPDLLKMMLDTDINKEKFPS